MPNRLYYADGYGINKIDIVDLVGESQDAAQRFLTTTTTPSIPTNQVRFLSANHIGAYDYLVISLGGTEIGGEGPTLVPVLWGDFSWGLFTWGGSTYGDGYGVEILANEIDVNTYADGYFCNKAQLTNDGKLYLINQTLNRVEVYYGAHTRSGTYRTPDFIYDGYSTPPLFANGNDTGTIHSLHVVNEGSDVLSGGTRLYVGQSIGMTIIDAFDEESSPGYSAGQDSNGIATYYGIAGSGATYENIGGTVPNVIDVETDELSGIVFVVTNDGAGHGGLTQISMSSHRRIIYMTKDSGFIPSDDIRDVSKGE